jgi:hypothetical protein
VIFTTSFQPRTASNLAGGLARPAFELRGADVLFFSCAEKKLGGYFYFLNVLLLKFDGLDAFLWHMESF